MIIEAGKTYKGNSGYTVDVVKVTEDAIYYMQPEYTTAQNTARGVFENWAIEEVAKRES